MKQKTVNVPILFPITLSVQWQSPDEEVCSSLPTLLKDWLLDDGSLMARLKSNSVHFLVNVIGEHQQLCFATDACELFKVGDPV